MAISEALSKVKEVLKPLKLIDLTSEINSIGNYIVLNSIDSSAKKMRYEFGVVMAGKSLNADSSSLYESIDSLAELIFNAYRRGTDITTGKVVLSVNEGLFMYETRIFIEMER